MFFDSDRPYHGLHACDCCGNLSAQQFAYVNKHGDIEQRCERCYQLAIRPVESPELVRRDRIAATVMAVIGGAALLIWLSGCAGGEVRHAVYDGIPVVEHIDTNDAPEPCTRGYTDGCWQMVSFYGNITHHIWRSDIGPDYVLKHEIGHAKGMRHTAWARHPFYRQNCATVTVGIEGYPLGALICNDGRKEWIVEQEAV